MPVTADAAESDAVADAAADAAADSVMVAVDAGLPPGLVAYFPLDGDLTDATSARVGSCTAGQCPAPVAGHLGQAYQFDGVDDCITVANDVGLEPAQLTLAIWARHAMTNNGSQVSKAVTPTSSVNSWQLETEALSMVPDSLSFTTYDGNMNRFTTSAMGTVPLNQWQHFAATWDGTTKRLYIDGVQVATSAMAGAPIYGAFAVKIGCDENSSVHALFFNGMLDDFQLYDRALTAMEIDMLSKR